MPVNRLTDRRMLDRISRREDESLWTAGSQSGMVVSAHYRASAAGLDILLRGGNAVDAAVATALALGVVEPAGSGLGGMAMMLIHEGATGRVWALEGPCRAPLLATPEALAGEDRRLGYRAVAVPSQPAVLDYAHRHYGKLPRETLFQPAIDLAETGYPVSVLQSILYRKYHFSILQGNIGPLVLGTNGDPPPAGARIRFPILAGTLRRLARAGFEDFYTGAVGREMVRDMAENGGLIRRQDLMNIPWPMERSPLVRQIGGWKVHSLGPPGGGVTLMEMLQLYDQLAPGDLDPDSPAAAGLFAAIIQRARFDRRRYAVTRKAPDLAGKRYAIRTAGEMKGPDSGEGETSHLCTMDGDGNLVSMTQSIERSFGAKVASCKLGVIYNGYLRTFKLKKRSHPYFLRPGAAARSNAAPTIVTVKRVPRFAIGSTGSERLASGIFQVLVRLKTRSPFQAVAAPRLHCTPEKEVLLEADRFSDDALQALRQGGFRLKVKSPWDFAFGGLHLLCHDGNRMQGVAEPRRDGAAAGL